MEIRAHYVLIGSFALAVAAAALLFILWLGRIERDFDLYQVVFNERVSGLSVGGSVQFSGIKVGEVRTLRLDPVDPSRVIAEIRVDKGTPVKTDTTAALEVVGVTGLAVIQFEGGDPDAPLLKDSTRGTPVIEATASDIKVILDTGEEILDAASAVLSGENIENLAAIVENLRILTDAIAGDAENLEKTMADLSVGAEKLAAAADSIESAATAAESVISHDARRAARDVSELAEAMTALIEDNRVAVTAFSRDGLGQAPQAMSEMRELMATLDRLLVEIERDPPAFFLGDSRPAAEARK